MDGRPARVTNVGVILFPTYTLIPNDDPTRRENEFADGEKEDRWRGAAARDVAIHLAAPLLFLPCCHDG